MIRRMRITIIFIMNSDNTINRDNIHYVTNYTCSIKKVYNSNDNNNNNGKPMLAK